ncbi:hypothetical protein BDZ89DRAFT_1056720 [Hymenopellis radicata]|nr:hypothetical protein BDZ89DRAFT_1056720 [Hymenopellis radicata]
MACTFFGVKNILLHADTYSTARRIPRNGNEHAVRNKDEGKKGRIQLAVLSILYRCIPIVVNFGYGGMFSS